MLCVIWCGNGRWAGGQASLDRPDLFEAATAGLGVHLMQLPPFLGHHPQVSSQPAQVSSSGGVSTADVVNGVRRGSEDGGSLERFGAVVFGGVAGGPVFDRLGERIGGGEPWSCASV